MIEQAEQLAVKAHDGQKRKNSSDPYIVHPRRVSEILRAGGGSAALICAGWLHDVVEDTEVTIEDIRKQFGNQVTELVAAHTENKRLPWKQRKQHTIDTVRNGTLDIKALIVADKLDNLLSIHTDQLRLGEKVWDNFNAGYSQQKWYYQSVASAMYNGLSKQDAPPFFPEYAELVEQTFD
ncbi:HD domain-containing protein [Halobacillus kuroshimensis]|uniref:HD domain-containing protein n=1 Tax=Halobacillus kuroshimensis TaxID=302481 RepID=UPI0004044DB3|nr:HD domain-containing protein [Halobacillus kuroshimensis]